MNSEKEFKVGDKVMTIEKAHNYDKDGNELEPVNLFGIIDSQRNTKPDRLKFYMVSIYGHGLVGLNENQIELID